MFLNSMKRKCRAHKNPEPSTKIEIKKNLQNIWTILGMLSVI